MSKFKVVEEGGRYTSSIIHGEKELDWMLQAVDYSLANAQYTGALECVLKKSNK